MDCGDAGHILLLKRVAAALFQLLESGAEPATNRRG